MALIRKYLPFHNSIGKQSKRFSYPSELCAEDYGKFKKGKTGTFSVRRKWRIFPCKTSRRHQRFSGSEYYGVHHEDEPLSGR